METSKLTNRIIWLLIFIFWVFMSFFIKTNSLSCWNILLNMSKIYSLAAFFVWCIFLSDDIESMTNIMYKIIDRESYSEVKYLTFCCFIIPYWKVLGVKYYSSKPIFSNYYSYSTTKINNRNEALEFILEHKLEMRDKRKVYFKIKQKVNKEYVF